MRAISTKQQWGKFEWSEEQLAKFKNPNDDPRGPWKAENLIGREVLCSWSV